MIRLMSETFDRATLFVRGVGYNICKPCQFFTRDITPFLLPEITRPAVFLPAETETGVGTARVRGKLGTHLARPHVTRAGSKKKIENSRENTEHNTYGRARTPLAPRLTPAGAHAPIYLLCTHSLR